MVRAMVCVTRQISCKRLIEAGARFARDQKGELTVVHVVQPGSHFLGNPSDGDALEYLFSIAKENDADINVLRSDNLIKTLTRHAQKNHITHIILGVSPMAPQGADDVSQRLRENLPGVEVVSIPA